MDGITTAILMAVLIVILLAGLGISSLRSKRLEKARKKELDQMREREKLDKEYMSAPASRSEILAQFERAFQSRVTEQVTRDFQRKGKNIQTQKGTWRVDYSAALQKKQEEYLALGINESGLLEFIKKNGGQVARVDLPVFINSFMNLCCRRKYETDRQSQEAVLQDGVSPELFLQAAKSAKGDLVGVYIIFNQTKQMYYVGQAKRLYFRVKQHFTGHGNGDVYADYKYGDSFLIRLITLRESGCDDLDMLERDMIAKYHANETGYNKTAGNKS